MTQVEQSAVLVSFVMGWAVAIAVIAGVVITWAAVGV